LEQDINGARAQLRDQWQGQGNQRNPFAGSVSATSGSGSLEGEGKLMALPQNLSRSCGFLPEGQTLFSMLDQISCRILRDGFGLFCSGKRLLQWLKNEGAINESIVVELFERSRWKRPRARTWQLRFYSRSF
jgi:hypothetical protein